MPRINIVTIFPEFFTTPLGLSIPSRAKEAGSVDYQVIDLRDFTHDRHRTVDDYPYGGGAGMVMKVDTIARAYESVVDAVPGAKPKVLATSPQGRVFDQAWARELAAEKHLVVVCGRYKGIDERVIPTVEAEEVSIGDYVLSGGEAAALVILDAVTRLQEGVLGHAESAEADSFSEALLDAPVYTRPEDVAGNRVPDVLLSGDHEKIRLWRRREAIRRTWMRRPDLLLGRTLNPEDRRLLDEIKKEEGR